MPGDDLQRGRSGSVARSRAHAAWADELCKFPDQDIVWSNLQMGLRLGKWPRCLVTSTPRPTPLLKKLISDPHTYLVRGSTYDNRENLAPSFVDSIITRYEGTRIGRQKLLAEVLLDTPGALWKAEDIERNRISGTESHH